MTGALDLFDTLAVCAGLVVILRVGLHASRRKRAIELPAPAVIGMGLWLAGVGFAFYLIFG